MQTVEGLEGKFLEFTGQKEIQEASLIKTSDGEDNFTYTFNEDKFKALSADDRAVVIAGTELQLVGYYFMGETDCDTFKEDTKFYEKMLSLK
eukprot:CAMPEP_0170520702 /NCGR_PEP_ID=MMETSP0209-20121228/6027_1 /TAXON_ID=665100 ORGANISM="Litonotus pictus, Strain P1" /NCGR_SAMPLE_ID=MMETSP0209 /ASSEMBLY_ACC=CAM_ASM_000301 /LENGTH=91 /DNA_ID=CAMNT_0010807181 /DNA_START=87 /DNA_END=362 /DNA_ORIENTATION=+